MIDVTHIRITRTVKDRLKQFAIKDRRTMTYHTDTAIERYLDEIKKKKS